MDATEEIIMDTHIAKQCKSVSRGPFGEPVGMSLAMLGVLGGAVLGAPGKGS